MARTALSRAGSATLNRRVMKHAFPAQRNAGVNFFAGEPIRQVTRFAFLGSVDTGENAHGVI